MFLLRPIVVGVIWRSHKLPKLSGGSLNLLTHKSVFKHDPLGNQKMILVCHRSENLLWHNFFKEHSSETAKCRRKRKWYLTVKTWRASCLQCTRCYISRPSSWSLQEIAVQKSTKLCCDNILYVPPLDKLNVAQNQGSFCCKLAYIQISWVSERQCRCLCGAGELTEKITLGCISELFSH